MIKRKDYNGNELFTKTLEFFFLPITTTKEISKDGPRGIGDSDITTTVEEGEVIGYDAIYGKAAGDKIRQLIFNNNGGQAAVIAMLPKIEN